MEMINQLYQILAIATKRFINENYSYRVSALTYTTLLAIIPILVITLFFTTWFPLFTYLISLTEQYIIANFVPTAAISLESYFQGFATKAAHLPVISILFLLITSVMLIHTIQETLNSIWFVETRIMNIKTWLVAWLILILAPIVVGISFFLTSYFFMFPWLLHITNQLGVTYLWIYLLSIIANTLIFAGIYIIIPDTHVYYRHGLIGGLIAACLFELAKLAFAYYLATFPNYELIYGAFSIIPIFLLWLYICWIIILFGGLITQACSQITKS